MHSDFCDKTFGHPEVFLVLSVSYTCTQVVKLKNDVVMCLIVNERDFNDAVTDA